MTTTWRTERLRAREDGRVGAPGGESGRHGGVGGVFTPRFRLHTGVTRLLDVFFDRASVFFEVGAIPVLLILGTIPFRPRVLTLHVTA